VKMFFKRTAKTRKLSRQMRLPQSDTKKASVWGKLRLWIGKKRHNRDNVLPVSNEAVSKAHCAIIDREAVNFTDLDTSSTDSMISYASETQNLPINSIQYQERSEGKYSISNRRGLSLCKGKFLREIVMSSSNENIDEFNQSNIIPTKYITRNEGAIAKATHDDERQQTALGRTISSVEYDVEAGRFVNNSFKPQGPMNVSLDSCQDKNDWRNEPFRVAYHQASYREGESKAKSKVFDDKTLTSADIDNEDNTGFSFEIVLDALSIVESDLDEDLSIDESCFSEESSFMNMSQLFLFNAILNAVSIFFNHCLQMILHGKLMKVSEHHPTIDIDRYVDIDARLLLALAFNRKNELLKKHRINSQMHRRNQMLRSSLVFSSVMFAYNFIG